MTDKTPKEKAYRRLTLAQWSQIVALWEFGEATLEDLAKAFEVSETAIRKGLKTRGSVKGCRAHEVGNAVAEQAKSDAAARVEKITGMKEKYLGWSDLLGKLTMKEIGDAVKAGVPLEQKKNNLVALNKAVANISRLRDENYHLFGLYDDNPADEELPELIVGEYTAEELDKIRTNFDEIEDELREALEEEEDTDEEEDDDVGKALVLPFEEDED
ncbi:MAG: hypothetical protein NXH70_02650 [Hyphomonas sp.]|nr:hypothetical protein [Hyphomonas sp.]